MVKIDFWFIKKSGEILKQLKFKGFLASSLSAHDFLTLYTTLLHILTKEKVEQTFNRDDSLYLACNEKLVFFHF